MTTALRIASLLATGLGALYSLVRAEHIFHIYACTGWVGPQQPPSFSEFLVFGGLAGILTLTFVGLGIIISYRGYIRKN